MAQQPQSRSFFTPEFEMLEQGVLAKALQVLGTTDRASRWLETAKWRFDGLSPIQMLRTQQGLRKVEDMLSQIDAGLFQ